VRRAVVALAAGAFAVVASGVGLGGCSESDATTPDLDASIARSTLFETHRAFALTVRSDGEVDVRIRSIQLDSPRFEAVEPQSRIARLRPGDPTVVMPLRFGDPRCGGEADGPAEVVADVDGQEVRIPLDESPADLLESLQASECAAARVQSSVDLRFGDQWEPAGPRTVAGSLELAQRDRGGGVTAVVDELVDNVIFTIEGDGVAQHRLAVSDARPSVTVPVRIHAARCDPHALIEYKRTFIFRARVRLGGGDPTLVDLEVEGPGHRALEDLLASCIG
jgi:hypothetical protein